MSWLAQNLSRVYHQDEHTYTMTPRTFFTSTKPPLSATGGSIHAEAQRIVQERLRGQGGVHLVEEPHNMVEISSDTDEGEEEDGNEGETEELACGSRRTVIEGEEHHNIHQFPMPQPPSVHHRNNGSHHPPLSATLPPMNFPSLQIPGEGHPQTASTPRVESYSRFHPKNVQKLEEKEKENAKYGIGNQFYDYQPHCTAPTPPLVWTSWDRQGSEVEGEERGRGNLLMVSHQQQMTTAITMTSGLLSVPAPAACNILVLGAGQVGKSSLINAYRMVNTHHEKWPAAPVGVCGKRGTISLDPYPNSPIRPTWVLMDTPGRLYTKLKLPSHWLDLSSFGMEMGLPSTSNFSQASVKEENQQSNNKDDGICTPDEEEEGEDAEFLAQLFRGLPWRCKLAGLQAVPLSILKSIRAQPTNRAHHCILVVSAKDIIEDQGFWKFWNRYKKKESTCDQLTGYLAELLDVLRILMQDRSPFVVVTHMDLFSSSSCKGLLIEILSVCVPINKIFLVGLPSQASTQHGIVRHTTSTNSHVSPQQTADEMPSPSRGGYHAASTVVSTRGNLFIPLDTRQELLRLHQALTYEVVWDRVMNLSTNTKNEGDLSARGEAPSTARLLAVARTLQ